MKNNEPGKDKKEPKKEEMVTLPPPDKPKLKRKKNEDGSEKKKTLPPNLETYSASRSSGEPEIEAPPSEDQDENLVDRIRQKYLGGKQDTGPDKKGEPKKSKYGKEPKKLKGKDRNEFIDAARMILSPFLIVAVGQALGEACEPTKEEADQFIEPMARLIARHVPMPEEMSADLIDIMSMASVGLLWYGRVRNDLPWNRGGSGGGGRSPQRPTPPGEDGRTRETENVGDTFRVEDFLNNG